MKKTLLLICILMGSLGQIFAFDLADSLYSNFQKYYNDNKSNEYLDAAYNSVYSKDPFGDQLKNFESMKMQVKVSGAQYIEDDLKAKSCFLSQKKIWGILYYFVPEFRAELARSLKLELGNMKSSSFVFDDSVIESYCKEYYICDKSKGYGAGEIFWKDGILHKDIRGISAATPNDIMTNCKEYFQSAYEKGMEKENALQQLQKSQLGADKYRNSSIDDSPYDIMADLNLGGSLLFKEVESPITPIFYNLPVFSNSKNMLNEINSGRIDDNSSVSDVTSAVIDAVRRKNRGLSGSVNLGTGNISVSDISGENVSGRGGASIVQAISGVVTPLQGGLTEVFELYDDLLEGLGTLTISDGIIHGNLCINEEEDREHESNLQNVGSLESVVGYDLLPQDYQELIDYMQTAIDSYVSLPEDVLNKISTKKNSNTDGNNSGELTNSGNDSSPNISEQIEDERDKIKKCRESCEGLRVDKKASCMMMCACYERDSSERGILDSNEFPGLGPIAGIRFCSVPGVDMSFSVGGKKIYSIEEGLGEILGVLDKLSREGKLGIRTQQNNFLDSTTKEIKISDMISFTIDWIPIDIGARFQKQSEQYKNRVKEGTNKLWQKAYKVSNPLNDAISKNQYRLVGSVGSIRSVGSDSSTLDFFVDQSDDSHASRYVALGEIMSIRLDTQGEFWNKVTQFMQEWESYAEALYAKK